MKVKKQRLPVLVASIILLLTALGYELPKLLAPSLTDSRYETATVVKHIDGDTFVAAIGNENFKVRLIGVDCPESTTRTEPYGKEASEYTKAQLLGKTVYLEKDAGDRDKYGRLLRYVWLSEPADVTGETIKMNMYNAVLVAEGYAQVMTVPPNVKYQDYFVAYQKEARNTGKGLWGLEVKADAEKETVPAGSLLIGNKNSKKLHRPECKWVKDIDAANRAEFESREEAVQAGYQPCKTCNP